MGKTLTVQQKRELALWAAYRKARSGDALDRLINHYRGYVLSVARMVKGTVPMHVDYEDLIAAGMFGLFTSIQAYNRKRCAKFLTFASKRVYGAMLDWLRKLDILPKDHRRRLNCIDQLNKMLANVGEAPASPAEICKHLRIPLKDYYKMTFPREVEHLDAIGDADDDTDRGYDRMVEDRRFHDNTRAFHEMLDKMLKLLPRKYAKVLDMYYRDGFTMLQIGAVLGISEGTVCNFVKDAKRMLNKHRYLFD